MTGGSIGLSERKAKEKEPTLPQVSLLLDKASLASRRPCFKLNSFKGGIMWGSYAILIQGLPGCNQVF